MKMKEILEKETDHIRHELGEQQKHLFTLRAQAVTEKLEDPSQIGKSRRAIARLKTVLRQRELEAQKSAAAPAKKKPAKSGKKETVKS
jgi:large subunit ribosomal protein L29